MLLATFRFAHDALALTETFEQLPELEIEAERVAAHGTEWTMPCLWATNTTCDRLYDVFEGDSSITSIVEATEFENKIFCQVNWSDAVNERIDSYIDHEASILYAAASEEGWHIRFRFGTRDQFDDFRETMADRDHAFSLLELSQPDEPRSLGGTLTPAQRNALRAANECGYYDVPRDISTRELASKLDMSHQNLSELLRRATGKLIDETIQPGVSDEF